MAHVVIGLGPTGGQALAAFRRLVNQEYQSLQPAYAVVRYLHIDTGTDPGNGPQWQAQGLSVALTDAERLPVRPTSLAGARAKLGSHPASRYLYERVEQAMRADDERAIASLFAGSRRLGRLLLSLNAAELAARLEQAAAGLTATGDSPLTFHIVFGVGEGMGGGLIEVVAAIRLRHPDPNSARILAYGQMPDVAAAGGETASSPLSGAYASLVELHAMATGALAPADFAAGETLVDTTTTLNAIYLFGETQENSQPLAPEDVPEALAQFMLQRIGIDDTIGAARLRQVEDGQGSFGAESYLWQEGETARLLTFGTKKLASPESEIREALALSFARAGLLQMLYNNWQDGAGFVDGPSPSSAAALVRRPETENQWLISEDHLLLSLAVLPEDAANKRWRAISDEWATVMDTFKEMARMQERAKWLDTFTALCHRRYAEDYRNVGVPGFYRSRYVETTAMATEVRTRIERDLFEEWRSGNRSLSEVAEIIDALIAVQDDRLAGIPERIARIRTSEDETRARIIGTFQKWASLGPLAKMTGKPDTILEEYAVQLHELHVKMTRAEAWAFANQFLPAILTELNDLKEVVAAVGAVLTDTLTAIDRRLDRLTDLLEATPDPYAPVVRLFSRERLRSVAATLSTSERDQIQQTTRLRGDLFAELGRPASFQDFARRFGGAALLRFVGEIGRRNADSAHATHLATTGERVLGMTVLDQIREMYGNDPSALRTFVDTALSATLCLAEINQTGPDKARRQYALLPRGAKPEAFAKQIRSVIRACATAELEFLETEQRPYEIGIVTIQSAVPLDQFANVPTYAAAYEARLFVDTATAFYEMHAVSAATPLMPIIQRAPERQKEKSASFNLPHLLIGMVLGHVYERSPGPATPGGLHLVPKDADGFDEEPVLLGADLIEASEQLGPSMMALLGATNSQVLDGTLYADPARRDGLRQALVTLVNRVKAGRGDDPADPLYRKYVEAAKAAAQMLKGDRR